MANNHVKTLIWLAAVVVAFFAGGWVFNRVLSNREVAKEVESLYSKDGPAVGIFDGEPQDWQEAEEIARAALDGQDSVAQTEPDSLFPPQASNSVAAPEDLSDVVAIISPEQPFADFNRGNNKTAVDLSRIEGKEIQPLQTANSPQPQDSSLETHRTLVSVPVKYKLIGSIDEYKQFKQIARGSYPTVDFDKQMLVVLESDSNLPDNVFETISAQQLDGVLYVTYRVNFLQLDKRLNSHAVLVVDKTQNPITLQQVL